MNDDLEDLLDRADMNANSGWERSFVDQMFENFEDDEDWEPTESQWQKLQEIADR